MGGLPEVESIREDDIMISEGELDIVLVDAKDIAKSRAFQLLQQDIHARQDLLEKVC